MSRDRDLRTIRDTYERYRREGRARIWDLQNRGYAKMVRDRDAAIVELLRRSLPAAGGTVLDLGSGEGSLAGVALSAALPIARWIGVDLDPLSVAQASAAYSWADFVEASADAMPFENATFDVVVASTLFSSLPSEEFERRVAIEISRVLRRTGRLVWYDLRYDSPGNPAVHGMGRKRILDLFPGWTAELRTITLIPPLARRLGPATPVAYPLLHALPILRSHLVGGLRPIER